MKYVSVCVAVALGLTALPAAAMARGQEPFVAEVNDQGHPTLPVDALIPADATGALRAFAGRPWWHAMAYCVAVHENQARKDAAGAPAALAQGDRFFRLGQLRLTTDRGITPAEAEEIMRPDMNFQVGAIAFEGRPYETDTRMCRDISLRYIGTFR